MEKTDKMERIRGRTAPYSRAELENIARTDKSAKVMEWETDPDRVGHALKPVLLANALVKIRQYYKEWSGRRTDDEIRAILKKEYADVAKHHPHLFFRLTDKDTTDQMVDAMKLMIAMREKTNSGKISESSAASIVSDYVTTFTVRDATSEELETGQVKKTLGIKPYLGEEAKDPLNAAPGKRPAFLPKDKKEIKDEEMKEEEKNEIKEKKETKKEININNEAEFEVWLRDRTVSEVHSSLDELRKRSWWCERCELFVDSLIASKI